MPLPLFIHSLAHSTNAGGLSPSGSVPTFNSVFTNSYWQVLHAFKIRFRNYNKIALFSPSKFFSHMLTLSAKPVGMEGRQHCNIHHCFLLTGLPKNFIYRFRCNHMIYVWTFGHIIPQTEFAWWRPRCINNCILLSAVKLGPEQLHLILALKRKFGIENRTRTEKGAFDIDTFVFQKAAMALKQILDDILGNIRWCPFFWMKIAQLLHEPKQFPGFQVQPTHMR